MPEVPEVSLGRLQELQLVYRLALNDALALRARVSSALPRKADRLFLKYARIVGAIEENIIALIALKAISARPGPKLGLHCRLRYNRTSGWSSTGPPSLHRLACVSGLQASHHIGYPVAHAL